MTRLFAFPCLPRVYGSSRHRNGRFHYRSGPLYWLCSPLSTRLMMVLVRNPILLVKAVAPTARKSVLNSASSLGRKLPVAIGSPESAIRTPNCDLNEIAFLRHGAFHALTPRHRARTRFLARRLQALVRGAMPATGRRRGCFRCFNQESQRAIHRLRIAKHLCQIRLDQHQVGSGDCLPVVLAANASLELRKLVLRTQIVI